MALVIADRIKETTTTTGTGALTLLGAMTGFRAFSAKCSVGDTCYYAIQAVDSVGSPTGDWECGLGTYSSVNTLTRTTVTSSSNSDSAVNFSAGTKQVYICVPAIQASWARERLTADRTYYVRMDGSDSNNGLSNTAGGAFLSIQKAANTICNTLSLGGYTATVQIADGTYTAATSLKELPDYGTVIIRGNATTPANVLVNTTSNTAFNAIGAGANYTLKDLKITTTTSGEAIFSNQGAVISFENINFGACAGAHIRADSRGQVIATGNYVISGAAPYHCLANFLGQIHISGRTITISGTPAFSSYFANSQYNSAMYLIGNTYIGSATGTRYLVSLNGVINSGVTLPGSVAGSEFTGGRYA